MFFRSEYVANRPFGVRVVALAMALSMALVCGLVPADGVLFVEKWPMLERAVECLRRSVARSVWAAVCLVASLSEVSHYVASEDARLKIRARYKVRDQPSSAGGARRRC